MNKIRLSIIIVSYEKKDIVVDCLNSIAKYNDIGNQLEVIVVENSKTNDIYDFLTKEYKNVTIIKNENKGFGEANNVGVRHSNGEYILFLNPDTILVEPIFKFCLEKFDENTDLALFGLKMIDENYNDNFSFFYIDKFGLIFNQLIKFYNKYNYFIDGKMFIIGANIFIRKSVFIEAGLFDENIFMYNEEADLIRRIKLKCSINKTNFYSEKKIIHLEGKTSEVDKGNERALQYGFDSHKYYCSKYNLDLKKRIAVRRRYEIYKLIINKILRKNRMIEKQETILKLYNDFYNSL